MGTVLISGPALADHPEVSLTGSNFEVDTNANLKVDDAAPSIDWASDGVTTPTADLPPGSGDDSFGNGSKEDTEVPSVVDGSIPPNKSDLLNFNTYVEKVPGGDDFLHMFWHRVQEPRGTTNMDFEFNQEAADPEVGNGVTPARTEGDLLIQYDLSQGGTNPTLSIAYWLEDTSFGPTYVEDPVAVTPSDCVASNAFPCWGLRTNLSQAGIATGSINTTQIPASESAPLPGPISARTFGEASVNLTELLGDSCTSFAGAYLKSRSSDSFTAALKDFIAPSGTPITNCATVTIRKLTDPADEPETTLFGFDRSFTVESDAETPDLTFDLGNGGAQTFTDVPFGTDYVVDESTIPDGWALDDIDCTMSTGYGETPEETQAAFAVDTAAGTVTFDLAEGQAVDCTYTNVLQTGSLLIVKDRKHAADNDDDPATVNETHSHEGVTFTVTGGDIDPETPLTGQTNADGELCFDDLLVSSVAGDYTVTEDVPDGYVSDDATKDVTVVLGPDCADEEDDPVTVNFLNTPLTDITVSVDSLEPGGTFSSIECDATVEDPDTDPDVSLDEELDDPSVKLEDLQPGTYTCVVVIDP
ncbi:MULTISPECIES: prealbumin-like fold domain-containing protein [unclassified Agromyces]|uniref:prealbumin-like fold domain-containing protein n=1 Tax=unclassified Agromyces TaxID=2639701 RepID=UPI0030144340